MRGLPAETDFVVLGAGIAGLRAAIELAAAGRVLMLAKGEIPTAGAPSASAHAAGGDLPLSDEDEISLRLQDTLSTGDGLCSLPAVKLLMEEGADRIEELIGWNAAPARGAKLVFTREGVQGHNRILHAGAGPAAVEILRALLTKAEALKNVVWAPFSFVTKLVCDGGRVGGVSLLDEKGVPQEIGCSAVLLATGGLGHIYRSTTNLATATGDGLALAYRAGAEVGDMEFLQFCATALYVKKAPRFQLADVLASDAAHLRNFELNRFMGKYHPMGELAPGDVVARAIVHEMEVSRAKDPFVYLDFTHLNSSKVQKRFPRIYAALMQHNIDITEDLVPVKPAAHFAVGGVRTDMEAKTSVAGLYAAGEVATTGVHGANRLPGNSVLEGLVFGTRAGRAMGQELRPVSRRTGAQEAAYSNGPVDVGIEELIGQIQDLMWNEVGLVRTRVGMQKVVRMLEEMAPKLAHPRTRRAHEAANLHTSALLVARSALAREESRGSHYRIDYPDHDDRKFLKHSVVKPEGIRFL
ncbi:MAG TPA: FAD-binding protein [Verrucomicrobiae bacterium]|nr:FAD-binding protein [Verrucomicrobiae bacterium]